MDYLLQILSEKGINPEELEILQRTFILLLALPVVTTITGFFRHIVGLKSLSVYAPIVLTFAFYELGLVDETSSDVLKGLKFGIILFILVFIASVLTYKLIQGFSMHYVPKTTIVLIGVSATMILSIFLGTFLFERKGLIYLDIFSIIIVSTLSETFVSLIARKDFKTTLKISIQTLLTAVISYGFISLPNTENIAVNYSLIVILALLLINIYI